MNDIMTPVHDDYWDRIPGVVKALIAVLTIFLAGMAGQAAVQSWKGVPVALQQHVEAAKLIDAEQHRRLDALEEYRAESDARTTSHFIYIGCLLGAIREGTTGARCELVLTVEDRRLLSSLKGAP